MKKTLVFLLLFLSELMFSQIGINNVDPKATLDVIGKPSEVTIADGIIAPRISRVDLISKTSYSTSQTGAIIYVTDLTGTTNTVTNNVTEIGYCFFDGSKWQLLATRSYIIGDTKEGFQISDHNGWIKLDGRAISSLTSTQQTQASTLGFTSNLPNEKSSKKITTRFTNVAITGAIITYTKVRGKNWIKYLIQETDNTAGIETFVFPEQFTLKPTVTTAAEYLVDGISRNVQFNVTTTQVSFATYDTSAQLINSAIQGHVVVEGEAAETSEIPNVFVYLGE